MQKRYKGYIVSLFALTTLIVGLFGANFVFAKSQSHNISRQHVTSSANPATARMVAMHTVNMQNVPKATARLSNHRPRVMPLLTGVSSTVYAQRKAAAAHNPHAPINTHPYSTPTVDGSTTPIATTKFQGMSDSSSICPYFGGCQPPDMALATSPSFVFQGVNTSFAVYSTSGNLQSGWPKTAQSFFGVPNPGSCDFNGPFLSDPRAFYDINDGRFWTAELQVEGAFGLNSCPFRTLYWIAVSQSSNPNGVWNVYAFDMSLGTTNAADYTQFGLNGSSVYFSANMFNNAGNVYEYAEVLGANKSLMESGLNVTSKGFSNLRVNGTVVDTVQPVLSESHSYGPRTEFLVNSFNINSGGGECSFGCSGLVVWSLANVNTTPSLSATVISTSTYTLAPQADEPGCFQCIETLDTRITATPVYHDGLISFALETGVNNGSQILPGILWGQVSPVINDSSVITSASLYQSGLLFFGGDNAISFGALMPDEEGNLFMVFDSMSNTISPSISYLARRVTNTLGRFHDNGKFLIKSSTPTGDSRWGDYSATSYDGFSTDNVWFAAEYSASNSDWSTYIGKDQFTFSNP
jgi:hypothetical protein